MEEIKVVGMDLAKNVFQVCGRDNRGKIVLEKTLRRNQVLRFFGELSPCLLGIEACGGSHYWARELRARGHEVKMISPQFVKPYVKSNKNDRADAEAISEAVMRPNMRFASIKTVEQQDVLCIHRVRERLIRNRTALANQIRGFLSEYGIVLPLGVSTVRKQLSNVLANAENSLTDRVRQTIQQLGEELRELDQRIAKYERTIEQQFDESEVCQRLAKIPGVGAITSTAVAATVGQAGVFRNGREMAAWLGLVPRQHSSGGKDRLLGISKRGDSYVRKLLVHGARAVFRHLGEKQDRRSVWLRELQARRGTNKAITALANKNARMLWVLMAKGVEYQKA